MDPPPPLPDLAASLERATLMATQLLASSDPSQVLQLHSALHSLHRQIALFLARFHQPVNPIPQLGLSVSPSSASAASASASRVVLGGLEVSMRGVDLATKRRRTSDDQNQDREEPVRRDSAPAVVDPEKARSELMELVFQFHA